MEVLTSILQHNRVEGQHWRAGVLGRTDRSKWPGQQASSLLARSLASLTCRQQLSQSVGVHDVHCHDRPRIERDVFRCIHERRYNPSFIWNVAVS